MGASLRLRRFYVGGFGFNTFWVNCLGFRGLVFREVCLVGSNPLRLWRRFLTRAIACIIPLEQTFHAFWALSV